MKISLLRILAPACLASSLSLSAVAQQSADFIEQHGITWTFSDERPVGQYANGDWWVLGPVSITSITPESVTNDGWTKNGTQVNPTSTKSNGFDSSPREHSSVGSAWNPDLNLHPSFTGEPLVLDSGSVVSSISRSRAAGRPQLDTIAILTVVASEPAEGSFRPGPSADGNTDRVSFWNADDLDYSILQYQPIVSGSPGIDSVASKFERPWVEFITDNQARYIHAQKNQPEYGRDIADLIGDALVVLHQDYTDEEKRMLYIRLVQLGIDIHSSAKAGNVWLDLGGINPGRKAPLVLAALALDDADMAEYADASKHFIFQLDRQTWYVTEDDVGRTLHTADNRPREQYTEEHVGLPEWGEQHTKQKVRDGSNWNAYYRAIINGCMINQAVAMQLTPGAVELWNWPAFFDYMDRAFEIDKERAGDTNVMSEWERDVWIAYRDADPVFEPSDPDPEPVTSWGGFPVDENGYFDTQGWFGWFYAASDDWLYSVDMERWIFAPDPGADFTGAWMFFAR